MVINAARAVTTAIDFVGPAVLRLPLAIAAICPYWFHLRPLPPPCPWIGMIVIDLVADDSVEKRPVLLTLRSRVALQRDAGAWDRRLRRRHFAGLRAGLQDSLRTPGPVLDELEVNRPFTHGDRG